MPELLAAARAMVAALERDEEEIDAEFYLHALDQLDRLRNAITKEAR